MGIPFLLDEAAWRMGTERWLSVDYEISPHVLWSGRTSSGKTVAAKLLLGRTILLAPPELQPVHLTILDPKEDIDFSYLNGLPHFFKGEAAPKGFDLFFKDYLARKEGHDLSTNLKVLFCDEFASLVSLIEDKKEREAAQRKLSLLLMLSRSRHCSVQLATQQPSAQIFGAAGSASREQFGVVCLLGDSGSETRKMLFDGDSRERMEEFGSIGGRGVGWLSLNGGIGQPVRVPLVSNIHNSSHGRKINLTVRRISFLSLAGPDRENGLALPHFKEVKV